MLSVIRAKGVTAGLGGATIKQAQVLRYTGIDSVLYIKGLDLTMRVFIIHFPEDSSTALVLK